MILYYFLLLSSVFFYLIILKANVKDKKTLYIYISFFCLILVSALRGSEVGGDLINYLPLYESVSKLSWSSIFAERDKYGYCFLLYLKIMSLLSSNNQFFLLITSIFNLSIVAFFIKKYSPIPWLSIYLYIAMAFYTNTFNSVRSSMSLAIGLFCIHYVIERKFWKFIICYLVALEIHLSFFPVILLYPLSQRKLSLSYILFIIGGAFVFSQLGQLAFIDKLIGMYSIAYAEMTDVQGGGYSLFFLLTFLTVCSYWVTRYAKNRSREVFIHAMVIACCIQPFATHFSFITRITLFFSITMIVLIPQVISCCHIKTNRTIITISVLVLGFLYFQYFVMTPIEMGWGISNSQGTIPYYFCWE